jgi:mono/diheme cytochrome c family protein
MDIALSVTLGLLLLLTALVMAFVMMRMADVGTERSAGLSRVHQVLGWAYVGLYGVMMVEMVPRLWHYQVELPARTVAHICLGLLVGVILLLKISFQRWYKHFADWLAPLDAALLLSTILMSGLSVPFGLREFSLARGAVGGGVYSQENRERVAKLLPQAGLPEDAPLADLASDEALRHGRDVLAGKCVVCHDLKTVLVQPRSPSGWWSTVERMVHKPGFSEPISEFESFTVTAYLIAISGDIQRSAKAQRRQAIERQQSMAEVNKDAAAVKAGEAPAFDEARAAKTYEAVCSQCHELAEVDAKPPRTADEVRTLIQRMVAENDLQATQEELDLVYLHMVKKFAG